MALIDITAVDRTVYADRIRDFLPDSLIDVHTHVFPEAPPISGQVRTVTWPSRVASCNPIEDLDETARLLFPGKTYTPVIFGFPSDDLDLAAANRYVATAARQRKYPALMLAHPDMTAQGLEQQLKQNGFLGIKVYLTFAPRYIPAPEIRIFDFLTHEHLEACDRLGLMVMLHIPRSKRIKDPVNLAQLLEIEKRYRNLQLVVAHVGRAYVNDDVGDALSILGKTKRMLFDISANTNDWVFEQLIRSVGSSRILYGSDLPIVRMRMRRIERDGHYVNLVPRGLYGDVSGDPNMAELDPPESGQLSFFIYEEIDAFREAAQRTGLTDSDVERVFRKNAQDMLTACGFAVPGESNGKQEGR